MGTPNYPKDFASEWNQVKRDVKNAFTSANLRTGMAKIGAKVIEITGELALNAGAVLRTKYQDGSTALYIGPATAGGEPVQAFILRRPNGARALDMYGGETLPGFIAIWDMADNIIVSDDAESGQGLARPYIPHTFVETSKLTSPTTMVTTSSWTSVHTIQGIMQHPKIRLGGSFVGLGGDTGRIRLVSNGIAFWTSGVLGSTTWVDETIAHHDYNFMTKFTYDIQVMRASGSSSGVGFTPTFVIGRQS
jgi:hypothetical protein